jgi:hypothetical protein
VEAIHLGLVQQQEERSASVDPVVVVGEVQLCLLLPGFVQPRQPVLGALT